MRETSYFNTWDWLRSVPLSVIMHQSEVWYWKWKQQPHSLSAVFPNSAISVCPLFPPTTFIYRPSSSSSFDLINPINAQILKSPIVTIQSCSKPVTGVAHSDGHLSLQPLLGGQGHRKADPPGRPPRGVSVPREGLPCAAELRHNLFHLQLRRDAVRRDRLRRCGRRGAPAGSALLRATPQQAGSAAAGPGDGRIGRQGQLRPQEERGVARASAEGGVSGRGPRGRGAQVFWRPCWTEWWHQRRRRWWEGGEDQEWEGEVYGGVECDTRVRVVLGNQGWCKYKWAVSVQIDDFGVVLSLLPSSNLTSTRSFVPSRNLSFSNSTVTPWL